MKKHKMESDNKEYN